MSRLLAAAALVVASLLALAPGVGAASEVAPPTLADALLIQSDVTHAPYLRLEGFVTNQSVYDVHNVRLHVEVLDTEGRRIAEASGWAFGDVLGGGRTYFIIALPAPGSTYRVTISSFDLLARRRG